MLFQCFVLIGCDENPYTYAGGFAFQLDAEGEYYTVMGAESYVDTRLLLFDVLNGKYVNTVAADAFSGCYAFIYAEIPNSITRIEAGAFSGCKSLVKVVLGRNVSYIGEGAFPDTIENAEFFVYDLDNIEIADGNGAIREDNVYLYSDTQPTESGLFWHGYFDYDSNSMVTIIWAGPENDSFGPDYDIDAQSDWKELGR